jgi:hypothetical protein
MGNVPVPLALLEIEKQLWSLKMAERIYVVGGPTGIRLVNATTKQQAIAHVANSTIKAHVASQTDLVDLLTKGLTVEQYKPVNMELDLGEKA